MMNQLSERFLKEMQDDQTLVYGRLKPGLVMTKRDNVYVIQDTTLQNNIIALVPGRDNETEQIFEKRAALIRDTLALSFEVTQTAISAIQDRRECVRDFSELLVHKKLEGMSEEELHKRMAYLIYGHDPDCTYNHAIALALEPQKQLSA